MKCLKEVLPNGLRIVAVPQKNARTATVMILVEAGSKYENKEQNGISHFLEHLCFKGTKKRRGPMDIAKELDSLGAQYNAFTGHEYTGYYTKVAAAKLNKALDIVSDLYLNPIFDSKEIEKEKGVIFEEMNMYEDMPNRKVQDEVLSLIYGDQPAGWSILGDRKAIKILKRDDVIKYREKHYVASATAVILSGRIDEKKIFSIVAGKFKDISQGRKTGKEKVRENQKKAAARIKFKKSDQSHLVLAFRSFPLEDERNYALRLLSAILGGSMSSRLWHRIREEMGAAYYVRAFNDSFTDHGVFQISAGVDTKRIKEVISVIIEELKKVKKNSISPEEIIRAKDSLIGNMHMALERSDDLAEFCGSQEIMKKKIVTAEEMERKIRVVRASDIQSVAREIFTPKRVNLAVIGPHKKEKEFVTLLKM